MRLWVEALQDVGADQDFIKYTLTGRIHTRLVGFEFTKNWDRVDVLVLNIRL